MPLWSFLLCLIKIPPTNQLFPAIRPLVAIHKLLHVLLLITQFPCSKYRTCNDTSWWVDQFKKIIRITVNKYGLDIGRKLISSYSWVWLVLPEGISWWFQITIPSGQVKEVQLGEISSIVILPVLFQILGFRFIKELKQAYKNISRCIVISLI